MVMSKIAEERQHVSQDGGRARSARVGGVMTILAMALVVYGTYGDSQASDSQKDGMPSVLVGVVVVALIVFGLLVPMAIRAVEAGRPTGTRWAVGLGVASVVSLVAFWSGLPILLGGAAALVAKVGREDTGGSRGFSWAWGLGAFAAAAAIVVTIIGNTLH
jgi:hypothetical protein